jgi:type IV pilus assembly protein PilE
MNFKTRPSRGFSLVELMITVGIVGILAAIAYPSYTAQVSKGRRAECRGGLMQSMQQQERYFTQYNSYASFTRAASSAPVRAFSGDSQPTSACEIEATTCEAAGSTAARCIELRGHLRTGDPTGISYLHINSDGAKGCQVGTTRTTTNRDCWP